MLMCVGTQDSDDCATKNDSIIMLMCSPFYYHSERVPSDGEDDSDDYVDVDEDDVIDNLDDDYESGSDGGNY